MTEIVNATPTLYDEVTDVDRLNTLFDAITEKRFVSPTIFTQAVRGACDLHGITLPHLEVEGIDGLTAIDGYNIQSSGFKPEKPISIGIVKTGDDEEYVFHIEDSHGNVTDDYLYMVIDQDEQGLFDCYAQIVSDEELQELLDMDEKDFPELSNVNSEYLNQTRHSRGDMVDDTPPTE